MTAKVNNQKQNIQKINSGLGNKANVNKPQVKHTLHGALPSNKNVNNQVNNKMKIGGMGKGTSPNSQKQNAFPTTFKKSGGIDGKQIGGSGLSTSHIQGRNTNLSLTSKLPTKTAPNSQTVQRSGTKI